MGAWTDLGDGVLVRRSRVWAMNSGVLLAGDHALLVDPGVLPSELADFVARVADVRGRLVVYTHHHWDHVLARPWLPDTTSVAHMDFAAALAADVAHARSELAACAADAGESLPFEHAPFAPDVAVAPGARVPFGPWTLEFHDARGHCDTQLALLVPEVRVLFAADMLSDREIPWLNRPAATYLETLAGVRALIEGGAVETLVPGHGEIASGHIAILARLAADERYLTELARHVGRARAAGDSFAATVGALAAFPHPALTSNPEMSAVHRRNVEIEFGRGPGSTA